MDLDLAEHIQRTVYLGAYERWETRIFRQYLCPGMCVVDVGANIGYFTFLSAQRIGPTGRVFAVEPSEYAADKLEKTLRINKVENVRLERCGLGAERGEARLTDPSPDNHSPSMLNDPLQAGKSVRIRTLDEMAAEWGIGRIDLLKVDVEGYEPNVFAGAEKLFQTNCIRAILCEFNAYWLDRAGTTSSELYRRLISRGFQEESGTSTAPTGALETRFLVYRSARN